MPKIEIPRITPKNENVIEVYKSRVFDSEDYSNGVPITSRHGIIIHSSLGIGFVESAVGAGYWLSAPSQKHARNIRVALQQHINHSFPEINNEEPVTVYCDGVQRTKLYMQTVFNRTGLEIPYDAATLRTLNSMEVIKIENALEDCRRKAEPAIRLAYHPLPKQVQKETKKQKPASKYNERNEKLRKWELLLR